MTEKTMSKESKTTIVGVSVSGAVSILMTFVFILVLSLLLVSLESARQQGAAAVLRMNLQTAQESVLGDYYAPLFDEYGLYGLYDVDIEGELRSYLTEDGKTNSIKSLFRETTTSDYSYAYELADLALTRTVNLLDGGSTVCRAQMVREGAVSGVQEMAETLLGAVHLLKQSEDLFEVTERQRDMEQRLQEMDELVPELMTLIDGIPTDKNGIVTDKKGKITPVGKFVKSYVLQEPTMETVHVNNRMLYEVLKDEYYDISAERMSLRAILESEMMSYEEKMENSKWERQLLPYATGMVLDYSEQALTKINMMFQKQSSLRPLVEDYENYLALMEITLGEDVISPMRESLDVMKGYAGITDNNQWERYRGLKARLEENCRILEKVKVEFADAQDETDPDMQKQKYLTALDSMTEYSLEGLELDYSEVHISENRETGWWTLVKDLVTNGITAGVYADTGQLSSKKLMTQKALPSLTVTGLDNLYLNSLPIDGHLDIKMLKKLGDGGFLELLLQQLAEGVAELSEKLLLIVYLDAHMGCFTDSDDNSVLEYEQEYLLFGRRNDAQNQQRATLSILSLRTVMNMIYVLTNPTIREEALIIATELWSWMPVPFLIAGTQYLLMIICGIQNAYLETAELIQGKGVPLTVTQSSFQYGLLEALTASKTARMEKAKLYETPSGVNLNYEMYLWLFMLFRDSDTLTLRALDLIQANIQNRYDARFLIKNCVFGFETSASIVMKPIFTGIVTVEGNDSVLQQMKITENGAVSY